MIKTGKTRKWPLSWTFKPWVAIHLHLSDQFSGGAVYKSTRVNSSQPSYTGSLMVNDVFAVFQTKASFFRVHHSLLRCVHQSARYGDTWNHRKKQKCWLKYSSFYTQCSAEVLVAFTPVEPKPLAMWTKLPNLKVAKTIMYEGNVQPSYRLWRKWVLHPTDGCILVWNV